jgi:hypothetical protein
MQNEITGSEKLVCSGFMPELHCFTPLPPSMLEASMKKAQDVCVEHWEGGNTY